jgi:hypothetical protein
LLLPLPVPLFVIPQRSGGICFCPSIFVLAVILSEAKDPETNRTAQPFEPFLPKHSASPQIIFTHLL